MKNRLFLLVFSFNSISAVELQFWMVIFFWFIYSVEQISPADIEKMLCEPAQIECQRTLNEPFTCLSSTFSLCALSFCMFYIFLFVFSSGEEVILCVSPAEYFVFLSLMVRAIDLSRFETKA